MTTLRILLAVLVVGVASTVIAEERSALWPDVPKATGEPHAEGNEYWRKNHMSLMQHDRDLTVQDGQRDIGASLKECFDCHTTTNSAGTVLSYADEGHFCRACHDFAAVKVDCFMCHRSTPDGVEEGKVHANVTLPSAKPDQDDAKEVFAYLQEIKDREGEQ